MPQRNSRMVCPDWAKRELYGEPYITRQEVCDYLGISISTLMILRKNGLPTYQVGGQKRFRLSDVNDFIKQTYLGE